MQEYIVNRVVKTAEYIISTGCTVRQAAIKIGVSKSTVHSDVQNKLKRVDKDLYQKVSKVLKYNLSVRHIRGGEVTKSRYKKNLLIKNVVTK